MTFVRSKQLSSLAKEWLHYATGRTFRKPELQRISVTSYARLLKETG